MEKNMGKNTRKNIRKNIRKIYEEYTKKTYIIDVESIYVVYTRDVRFVKICHFIKCNHDVLILRR